MGIFRKIASVSTLGAIDFRSAKDRTAAYSRGTRTQARKQTKIMAKAARREAKAARQAKALDNAYRTAPRESVIIPNPTPGQRPSPAFWPAGWYTIEGRELYWNGTAWSDPEGRWL